MPEITFAHHAREALQAAKEYQFSEQLQRPVEQSLSPKPAMSFIPEHSRDLHTAAAFFHKLPVQKFAYLGIEIQRGGQDAASAANNSLLSAYACQHIGTLVTDNTATLAAIHKGIQALPTDLKLGQESASRQITKLLNQQRASHHSLQEALGTLRDQEKRIADIGVCANEIKEQNVELLDKHQELHAMMHTLVDTPSLRDFIVDSVETAYQMKLEMAELRSDNMAMKQILNEMLPLVKQIARAGGVSSSKGDASRLATVGL